jgi:hypothetical protein
MASSASHLLRLDTFGTRIVRMPASASTDANRSAVRPQGSSHATHSSRSPLCMARRCRVARVTTQLSGATVSSGSHARLTNARSSHRLATRSTLSGAASLPAAVSTSAIGRKRPFTCECTSDDELKSRQPFLAAYGVAELSQKEKTAAGW